MKPGLASYLRQYNESPNTIRLTISVETTGLEDPKIVDIATISKFLYEPVKLSQYEKQSGQVLDVDPITGNLLEFQTINYELLSPNKHIEEGASKIHGITDDVASFGSSFSDSKFLATYKNLLNSNAAVELVFANSYALTVLNNELISARVSPIYEFSAENLTFHFNPKFRVYSLDDLAMRFYSKDLSTFSLKKIQDLSDTVYGRNLNNDERETLSSALNAFANKSPNAVNAINKATTISEITKNFIMANPEIRSSDLNAENKSLDNFPFRRIGKQVINDLRSVSVHHLFAILSKTEEQKGVATIATLKKALALSEEINKYKETYGCKSNQEAFVKKAIEDGLIDLSDRGDFSKLFNGFLNHVENSVNLKDVGAENVSQGANDIIKRISETLKEEGLTVDRN